MPDLDWPAFTRLAGTADRNFEHLTYDLVKRHFGTFGTLVYPSNAVGVEFTLQLREDCALGHAPETIAWQCKWYHPEPRLNGARHHDIKDSFKKSMRRDPVPAAWYLVTPHAFTEDEEKWLQDGVATWIRELADDEKLVVAAPRVAHWSEVDLDGYMRTPHDVVVAAWFGQAVLDDGWFRSHIARSTARLHGKFLSDLHVSTAIEKPVHDALGDEAARAWLAAESEVADKVVEDTLISEAGYRGVRSSPPDWSEDDNEVVRLVERLKARAALLSQLANQAAEHLAAGRVDQALLLKPAVQALVGDDLSGPLYTLVWDKAEGVRAQRMQNDLLDWASQASSDAVRISEFAEDFVRLLDALGFPLIAVVGSMGRGKSHLAAHLTSGFGTDAPRGVLLHGIDFARRFGLDSLPTRLGIPRHSLEEVVAALDVAGKASGRRAVITIDGLHESEDPSDWSGKLPELLAVTSRYANVLVVVTVRPTYTEKVWPANRPPRLIADGFGPELAEAIERYFTHYKIKAHSGSVGVAPYFRDPMLLRIFCEATNPDRLVEVDVDLDETGIDELFDKLLDRLERQVADARGEDYHAGQVRSALFAIALRMWSDRSRSVPFLVAKEACGDRPEAWTESRLRRILEEDLFLARESDGASEYVFFPVDRFAGHCIAGALLERDARAGVAIGRDPEVIAGLCDPDPANHHPLREDILSAIAQLTARAGSHLFDSSDEPLLQVAGVRALVDLPPARVPDTAPGAIRAWWDRAGGPDERREILELLARPALRVDHPLNFHLSAELLRELSMPELDVTWTERLRSRAGAVRDEVGRLETQIRAGTVPDAELDLILLWASWLLSSTDRDLRDHATRALYWIGRNAPDKLFAATVAAAGLPDPSIRERLLAASYGTAMARAFAADVPFRDALAGFGQALVASMLAEGASHPTTHILARDYARWTVELAEHVGAVPAGTAVRPPFRHTRARWEELGKDSPEGRDAASSMRMDFENYTIGRLVEGRANYDMDNPAYRAVLESILWRVRDLGYRRDTFGDVDRRISDRSWDTEREGKTDRYGKKYAWIAFYEEAGRLEDEGALPERRRADGHGPDADLDPSFPEPIPTVGIALGDWLGSPETPDLDWLRLDPATVGDDLLIAQELDGEAGPWIVVWGQIVESGGAPGRQVFALTPGALIPKDELDLVIKKLLAPGSPGRWALPEPRGHYYVYAGELPWSPLFAVHDDEPVGPDEVAIGIAHEYAWEGYHSTLNRASGAPVPSQAFAESFGLIGRAQTFDLFESDGRRASISCCPDAPWEGQLLYIRADLLRQYAESMSAAFVWLAWGERQLLGEDFGHDSPVVDAIRKDENLHRRVVTLDLESMSPHEVSSGDGTTAAHD